MSISVKKSAIASAFLIGALAFTGCGAVNDAKDAASAAVESAAQASLDGIQTFADDFTKNMTSNTDSSNKLGELTSDSNFVAAMTALSEVEGSDVASIEEGISKLSDDQKTAVKKLTDSVSLGDMTDYGNLTEDQKLTFAFTNYILSSSISSAADGVELSDNTVNTDDLSLDGTRVKVPMKAIQDLASNDEDKNFFGEIPAVYSDGSWKLDGEKYYENLKNYVGDDETATATDSATASESASSNG